jgi:hypothetical protein
MIILFVDFFLYFFIFIYLFINTFLLVFDYYQVSDGAAAVLLMKRKTAQALGVPILGTFKNFRSVC